MLILIFDESRIFQSSVEQSDNERPVVIIFTLGLQLEVYQNFDLNSKLEQDYLETKMPLTDLIYVPFLFKVDSEPLLKNYPEGSDVSMKSHCNVGTLRYKFYFERCIPTSSFSVCHQWSVEVWAYIFYLTNQTFKY